MFVEIYDREMNDEIKLIEEFHFLYSNENKTVYQVEENLIPLLCVKYSNNSFNITNNLEF